MTGPVAQVAGYRRRALARTPESMRKIRDALAVGTAGARLGLDTCPGVVWVRVTDHGSDGVHMGKGQAYVEVWGGKPVHVFATVSRNVPPGIMAVVRWRPAGPLERFKRWARFTLWRLVDRIRGVKR